jgi:hypothetical protein
VALLMSHQTSTFFQLESISWDYFIVLRFGLVYVRWVQCLELCFLQ